MAEFTPCPNCDEPEACDIVKRCLEPEHATSSAIREAAYDQIDRFLRNNLDDEDYADYSQALDLIYAYSAKEDQHG